MNQQAENQSITVNSQRPTGIVQQRLMHPHPKEKRIIFAEALTAKGEDVPIRRALDADILRYPVFLAELNGKELTFTMELPRRHSWGTIPVPAF